MKKYIFTSLLVALLVPMFSFAAFDVSLKYGSKGEAVGELQDFLQDQGYYTGKIDGKFGLGTLRAVKIFQSASDLKADGYFGVASRAKANSILAELLKDSDNTEAEETGGVAEAQVSGCTPGDNYSKTTGLPCSKNVQPISNLPAGCSSLSGFSISTGKPCAGSPKDIQDKLDELNTQVSGLAQTIQSANTPAPAPAPQPAPAPVPEVEPLVFTVKPKLFFLDESHLAYITWQTNRPSKLEVSPVMPLKENGSSWMGGLYEKFGQPPTPPTLSWSTGGEGGYGQPDSFSFKSCGLQKVFNSLPTSCKIKVIDAQGLAAETTIITNVDFENI